MILEEEAGGEDDDDNWHYEQRENTPGRWQIENQQTVTVSVYRSIIFSAIAQQW